MGALKSVQSNRGLGIKAKKYLYEVVIVPTALYGAEAWGIRSAERRKVNVIEMKCLINLVGVSRMDRVWNEDVRMRAGIESELASRADQRVLRRFGHVERLDQYRMDRRVLMADVCTWRIGTRKTEVRLDGWCEGGFEQQNNEDGGGARMNERSERVDLHDAYVTEWISRCHFTWHCFRSDRPRVLWWLSPGEGWMPLHDAVGINCKYGATTENQGAGVSIWA